MVHDSPDIGCCVEIIYLRVSEKTRLLIWNIVPHSNQHNEHLPPSFGSLLQRQGFFGHLLGDLGFSPAKTTGARVNTTNKLMNTLSLSVFLFSFRSCFFGLVSVLHHFRTTASLVKLSCQVQSIFKRTKAE